MAGRLGTFSLFQYILSGSCPVKPPCFFFFFSFLAAELLRRSSLGSATEGIKSTRIVAESVLLIQFPQWDFFHPMWGLKPVTFKAHSRLSDLYPRIAPCRIFDNDDTSANVSPVLYVISSFSSFSLPFPVCNSLPLFLTHTIFFWVHWQAADQNKGVSHYALFQSIIIFMGCKNSITLFKWCEHCAQLKVKHLKMKT